MTGIPAFGAEFFESGFVGTEFDFENPKQTSDIIEKHSIMR